MLIDHPVLGRWSSFALPPDLKTERDLAAQRNQSGKNNLQELALLAFHCRLYEADCLRAPSTPLAVDISAKARTCITAMERNITSVFGPSTCQAIQTIHQLCIEKIKELDAGLITLTTAYAHAAVMLPPSGLEEAKKTILAFKGQIHAEINKSAEACKAYTAKVYAETVAPLSQIFPSQPSSSSGEFGEVAPSLNKPDKIEKLSLHIGGDKSSKILIRIAPLSHGRATVNNEGSNQLKTSSARYVEIGNQQVANVLDILDPKVSTFKGFAFYEGENGSFKEISLPKEVEERIVIFLDHHPGQATYDCGDFVAVATGCRVYETRDISLNYKAAPGDPVYMSSSETKGIHLAINLSEELYLSKYGYGGPLLVSTLPEMMEFYKADRVCSLHRSSFNINILPQELKDDLTKYHQTIQVNGVDEIVIIRDNGEINFNFSKYSSPCDFKCLFYERNKPATIHNYYWNHKPFITVNPDGKSVYYPPVGMGAPRTATGDTHTFDGYDAPSSRDTGDISWHGYDYDHHNGTVTERSGRISPGGSRSESRATSSNHSDGPSGGGSDGPGGCHIM